MTSEPSSAAKRIASKIQEQYAIETTERFHVPHYIGTKPLEDLINAELAAEREASEGMAEFIRVCGKCECQGKFGKKYTCLKCGALAAYERTQKGE